MNRSVSFLICFSCMPMLSPSHAQTSISDEGVIFSDDTVQTSAVPTDCPHSESIVWDTNAEIWVCESDISPTAYDIGDTGPAGGIVFHVTDGGSHGLEAAPADQSTGLKWGCSGTAISGADGTAVGSGAQNTAEILADCNERAIAASVSAVYFGPSGDTVGWFLPSIDELEVMYQNRVAIGGFCNCPYWSSSETGASTAEFKDFDVSGGPPDFGKLSIRAVRAIRAF